MYIHCIGLNHQTASVQLRERLAFSDEGIKAALARLGCGVGTLPGCISEMAILSTCNRVEVYAVAPYPAMDELEAFMADARQLAPEELSPHLYRLQNQAAVEHLFRVAAGLDSLVLGESQILGQVMHALELARGQGAAGALLTRLFQAALHAGKRARSETAIGQNPASISSVAVRLAAHTVPHLQSAQVVVLGAGEMAELAVEALRKRGAQHILVINRTLSRASQLAQRWHGEAGTFEQLSDALLRADILIASTGAPHSLVHADMVEQAMRSRPRRPLAVIDIAIPRDVDAAVAAIPGVRLYDLDSLQHRLQRSLDKRADEIPAVLAILQAEKTDFMTFLDSLEVLPLIAALRQRAETIRATELEKTLRRLPELGPGERQRLEALTHALVKRLLHAPTVTLRAQAGSPQVAEYAAAARALFDIDL